MVFNAGHLNNLKVVHQPGVEVEHHEEGHGPVRNVGQRELKGLAGIVIIIQVNRCIYEVINCNARVLDKAQE